MPNLSPEHWFLGTGQVPRTPSFTEGNEVTAFIDGADYMEDLRVALSSCDRGVYLAGWRFTGQQHLRPSAPQVTVIDAVRNTIPLGARVRAMVYLVTGAAWPGPIRVWHGADNRLFADAIRTAGQEAILDARLSPKALSSHHQKYVIVESSDADRSRAYVGGIDLCFDRWDTPAHASPPERDRDVVEFYIRNAPLLFGAIPPWLAELIPIPDVVDSFLPSMPAWHDVQARLRGPALRQVWDVFAARWNDARPANAKPGLEAFRTVTPVQQPPAPVTVSSGSCFVQVLQTLPCLNAFPFAPGGEQTVLAAYARAIDRAEHFIYIEDQYLWPSALVDRLDAALRRNVRVLVVVARDYDLPGLSVVHQHMRARVVGQLRNANPALFRVLHLQQPGGGQIYVHAKTLVVDDAVAFIGSANLNHRSMTNDTELQLGIVDSVALDVPFAGVLAPVGRFVHDYRVRLWAEHLQVPPLLVMDPIAALDTLWATAPLPGGRAHPHGAAVTSALDIPHVSQVVAQLLASGEAFTTLAIPLPPVAAGVPALQGAVAAALTSVPDVVLRWLEDVLNPQLMC